MIGDLGLQPTHAPMPLTAALPPCRRDPGVPPAMKGSAGA
jgi:hypothetical protein